MNTTVLQDVSTKVSGFLGKMFKKKDKVSDKMLPTELFKTDDNVYMTTQGNYTTTNGNVTPKSFGIRSPLASATSIKTTKK